MVVLLDPSASKGASTLSAAQTDPQVRPSEKQSSAASPPEQANVPQSGHIEANVTFRRDAVGQIYYVVTDAQTGKELREFPPSKSAM